MRVVIVSRTRPGQCLEHRLTHVYDDRAAGAKNEKSIDRKWTKNQQISKFPVKKSTQQKKRRNPLATPRSAAFVHDRWHRHPSAGQFCTQFVQPNRRRPVLPTPSRRHDNARSTPHDERSNVSNGLSPKGWYWILLVITYYLLVYYSMPYGMASGCRARPAHSGICCISKMVVVLAIFIGSRPRQNPF